jgi:sugar phosphate isomerase/epimerase
LAIAAVSGTWNMIHPDPAVREAGLRRLPALLGAARALGCRVVTLCTGSRDPGNMWQSHPDNQGAAAWADLRAVLEPALAAADQAGVTLGVEPETANVVDSAGRARRLLDDFPGAPLGIVLDPANLLRPGAGPAQATVLQEAFHLLGGRLVLAHAKEWTEDGHGGARAAGAGQLDWDLYLALLRSAGFDGPLILHGFAESAAAASVAFLLGKLRGDGQAPANQRPRADGTTG